MRNHTGLKVFHLADCLALLIYERTRLLPREEQYGLCSQMRRAAVSIAANIVEGAARRTDREFAYLLSVAYGSARELEYQISLATRLGYFSADDAGELSASASQTSRALRALTAKISNAP